MSKSRWIAIGVACGLAVDSFLVLMSSTGEAAQMGAKVYGILFLLTAIPAAGLWSAARRRPVSTAGLAASSPDATGVEVEPNMGGMALALVAATLAVISVFLPSLETSSFAHIERNTLIQSHTGYLVLGCAVGIIGAVYRAYAKRTLTWAVLVLGAVILGAAIYGGTGSRTTLTSTSTLAGKTLTVAGSPAVGLYAAGAAGVLAMLGGLVLGGVAVPSFDAGPGRLTKTCPDCAETVLDAARVCKHCGHEFSAASHSFS